jgi:nicotinamidase-related amidase
MKSIFGLNIPQTFEEVCSRQRIALLVYDMQVGILSQIKNADQVTRQVLKVLTAARQSGVRVFFSRHLSLPKELMGMFQFRMAMAWQRTSSPGIEPTARHGADLGYIPVIVTDACGDGDEEAAKRSIESLKFNGDAVLTDTETICAIFQRSATP